jgi:hypothetical protein
MTPTKIPPMRAVPQIISFAKIGLKLVNAAGIQERVQDGDACRKEHDGPQAAGHTSSEFQL